VGEPIHTWSRGREVAGDREEALTGAPDNTPQTIRLEVEKVLSVKNEERLWAAFAPCPQPAPVKRERNKEDPRCMLIIKVGTLSKKRSSQANP